MALKKTEACAVAQVALSLDRTLLAEGVTGLPVLLVADGRRFVGLELAEALGSTLAELRSLGVPFRIEVVHHGQVAHRCMGDEEALSLLLELTKVPLRAALDGKQARGRDLLLACRAIDLLHTLAAGWFGALKRSDAPHVGGC